MQLLVILAVLGSLVAADAAPATAVADPLRQTLLCAVVLSFVVLLARVIATATVVNLRRDFSRRKALLARYERFRQVHAFVWIAAVGVVFFGLHWAQIVRESLPRHGSLLLDDVLVLLPVLLPLVLSWWAFGAVERALEEGVAASCGLVPRHRGGLRGLALQVRHELAPVLIPLLIIVAINDLLTLVAPGLTTGRYASAVFVPPLIMLAVAFPCLLKYIWNTEPLSEGPLRQRLEQVQQRLGVRTRGILVWRTGGTVCNAAVAGLVPWLRYVFLSDGLIQRMSADEIAAVYAHELGHVRHRHLTLRMLAVVLPVVLWRAAAVSFPNQFDHITQQLTRLGLPSAVQVGAATLVVAGAYAMLIFAWYSRVLEKEADLCGCRAIDPRGSLTHEGTEQFVAALSTLALTVYRPASRSWLHPALTERVAFVRRLTAEPALREEFDRRTRRMARLLAGLVVVAALWPLVVSALGPSAF